MYERVKNTATTMTVELDGTTREVNERANEIREIHPMAKLIRVSYYTDSPSGLPCCNATIEIDVLPAFKQSFV